MNCDEDRTDSNVEENKEQEEVNPERAKFVLKRLANLLSHNAQAYTTVEAEIPYSSEHSIDSDRKTPMLNEITEEQLE